ncbi:hypothetical protein AUEXF2481DRAFT_43452 [Aureobasidium subglaciale EXF-2481]|uniref:Vacuolar fusion protein MON1 n=1 Tax=Aureobasidium subglaciale (strain EXF-2481) TaxID=1043005 RepID=A0A074YYY8_AURSE|nr:uncharacterized protein AUEXF2481DRAFT_43452 [Aureobasidium subglaciale EXF-2481]KAI5207221.1 DUF254-domain-containing protein [Aureobasidium subglaciale]KAI5229479.1 DUF254-domain-containing protein [Aureobasidium subglaciale]KAI5264242.1 DUF254-domain-containing protein [Aureobasidium subglaciale]KEQ92046.1 hypothetical protein AUEXF2481DRAFT_43452 [Aureobasidium subglaciale EXF-2481]
MPDEHDQSSPGAAVIADQAALDQTTSQTRTTSPGPKDKQHGEEVMEDSREIRPPLPPRPTNLDLLEERGSGGSIRLPKRMASRPNLQARPTTAVSLTDVHTSNNFQDHASRTLSPPSRPVSRKQSTANMDRFRSRVGSDAAETSSVRSYANTLGTNAEMESLLGDPFPTSPAWKSLSAQLEKENPMDHVFDEDDIFSLRMHHEFDELEEFRANGTNEEFLMNSWTSKLKHFFILSSAGKPIWSRHGDDQVIANHIGILQTLISFYQDVNDNLRGFTAGNARFVILSKGHLNLAAISRLGESDLQLKTQLESLYMQILSTLTLPSMERMFSNRPSTDLRRPLQGTEVLLGALADGFTRGSLPTLLSALECLKIRKSHRQVINNTLLKVKSPNLLYGLLVAGGRLVSVVRPRKHSLHPGDLQLIFNMLFEAGSVKAGGGENWIPLCLPGFNNTGFLYMYVSFLDIGEDHAKVSEERPQPSASPRDDDQLAIILISADKEAFYELRQMRDDLIDQLNQNNSMSILRTAIHHGRPSIPSILPSSPLLHFIYKSRPHVQFFTPSFSPNFTSLVPHRRLVSLYSSLHTAVHNKTASLKVHYACAKDAVALGWVGREYEFYGVAGAGASREGMAKAAQDVVRYLRREEERVFIIGGAVF